MNIFEKLVNAKTSTASNSPKRAGALGTTSTSACFGAQGKKNLVRKGLLLVKASLFIKWISVPLRWISQLSRQHSASDVLLICIYVVRWLTFWFPGPCLRVRILFTFVRVAPWRED